MIVEDNVELVDYIKEYLRLNADFQVLGFASGVEALNSLKKDKPDLLLIDLQLEDLHGESICRDARRMHQDLPIIILTGDKSPQSIISCLNSGADDYITKPFNAEELLARINARLRMRLTNSNSTTLACGDLVMNTETLEVFRGDEKVSLTAKEFELLRYLLLNKARVATRDKILYAVWGYTTDVDTRVVDVHIGKLRKKLETDDRKYIDSVRGFGYKMID